MHFASVPEALEIFRRGEMLIVVDDEDRENEGDLTLAADFATPAAINFMAAHGRGLVCLALDAGVCDRLDLPLIAPRNTSNFGTAFTVPVDARTGVTTGISAADRAHTIRTIMDPSSTALDLARPGHLFPLRARDGGVLVRAGQTEAAVDLARLAGCQPGGVICEIMNPDGTMARLPDLRDFALHHGLKILSVADLIRYRLQHETFIRRISESTLKNEFGEFTVVSFLSIVDQRTHSVLVLGEPQLRPEALVRVHRVDGDIFHTLAMDLGIRSALQEIRRAGTGALVCLQLSGPSETGPLQHETGIGAQILADLGLRRIRLLTNHPRKIVGLEAFGIEVVDLVAIPESLGTFQPTPSSSPA